MPTTLLTVWVVSVMLSIGQPMVVVDSGVFAQKKVCQMVAERTMHNLRTSGYDNEAECIEVKIVR
jgi:hypothetical protein